MNARQPSTDEHQPTMDRCDAGQVLSAKSSEPSLRRDLYAQHERLAYSFANRVAYRVPSAYREDLLQEARLGLWEATERFDPSRGCRFSTYAWIVMRKRVLRFLAHGPHLIRLPDHLRSTVAAVYTKLAEAAAEGHTLDLEALAAEVGTTGADLQAMMAALTPPLSLDKADDRYQITDDRGEGTPSSLSSVIRHLSSGSAATIDEEVLTTRLWVREALDELPEEQRRVILLRFGFNGRDEQSLRQVAAQLGRSQEWVRQTEKKALAALREALLRERRAARMVEG